VNIAEGQLIENCLKGERKAQQKLFESYAGVLSRVCRRYIQNEEDARDVFQEGFIKIFRSLESFRHQSSLETWMTRIMINSALSYLRSAKLTFSDNVTEIADFTDDEHESSTDKYQDLDTEKVMDCVRRLPDGYRTVMNLYVMDGYSHKDIAHMLGISENTSKTQLLKARKKVKEFFESSTSNNHPYGKK
jgi:RNA polymerase sigma-70 factor (ECF subfamily)